MLPAALAAVAGFILGIRLGIALGYRGEQRRRAALDAMKRKREQL